MTKPTENSDFTKRVLKDVDRVLPFIEDGWGLTRSQAVECLESLSVALEDTKAGGPEVEAAFHDEVGRGMNNFESWANKVNETIRVWGKFHKEPKRGN